MEKKHYKKYYGYYKKDKQNPLRCMVLILLSFVIVYMMHFIIAIHDNRGFYAAIIEFIMTWYYIFEVIDVIRLQKNAIVNEYGKKCIFFHRYLSLGALLFSVFFAVLSLFYEIDYNIILLIYIALVFGGITHFTMLFMFEEDYYYSGGFKVFYSEINHIEIEDEVHTSKGLVVVCKLMKDEKVVGYDRMVVQDFICLKNKIDENMPKE
jgi:hypothetical protein